MPSWNIHLEAGNRLSDKLCFDTEKKREFLVGCLLPDINNGYINNPRTVKTHEATHFAFLKKSSLNFYREYKKEVDLKMPIYLGYIFHLFTDGYFNYDFFHRAKHAPSLKDLTHDQKNDIKHHDFWKYDSKYHHTLDLGDAAPVIVKKANQIKEVRITLDDLLEIAEIMSEDRLNQRLKRENYQFYQESELDDLLKRVINEFSAQYLGATYA